MNTSTNTSFTRRLVQFARPVTLAAVLVWIASLSAVEAGYVQTNLVSDIPGLAPNTDPNLKNPWGVSFAPNGPFWVSNQVTGTVTLYDGAGQRFPVGSPLVVTVPSASGGGPTGQVFNPTSDFPLTTGGQAFFLFANLDGTISGWNPAQGTFAEVRVSTPGGEFTGLALGNNGSGNFLYAADPAGGQVRVFDANFMPTSLPGAFVDPNLPAGFSLYNIQNLNGTLYVTYENEDAGGGVVNAFDLSGNFLRRVSSNADGGPLDSPWGLALAPSSFGQFGNALLVGNEDDGHISAFDPLTGQFLGQLHDNQGNPIANTGLWGLVFGSGGLGSDPNVLYFAAGINDEENGLFGSIAPAPDAGGTLALLAIGIGAVLSIRRLHSCTR
jgi:uncharacterized protein (TIGR03118 family)